MVVFKFYAKVIDADEMAIIHFVHFLTSSLYPCHEMALLKISGFGIEKW